MATIHFTLKRSSVVYSNALHAILTQYRIKSEAVHRGPEVQYFPSSINKIVVIYWISF